MVSFAFWISACLAAYVYVGYPLAIFLWSVLRPRPWKSADIYPSVSLIMAVHNGAPLLPDKIDHLLNLDYPQELVEILIVSDGSDDGTNEILGSINASRLTLIVSPQHRGKASALNQAIVRASGEVLVFVDIRPKLEKDALRRLVSSFADPTVGCVAGELCLRVDDHKESAKAVSSLYWRYEQWIRKCESRVDSPVGVYGGFYAVRKSLACTFPDGLILDDMYQPLSVVRQGFRSVIDERATVWDSWPKTLRGEFQRKVRTLAGNYELLQRAPWLLGRENRLRFQLVSHKLLRLVVPFALVTLLAASYGLHAHQPYHAALVLQVLFYTLALFGLLCDSAPVLSRIASPAAAFVSLNAAAVVASFMFLFRRGSLLSLWARPGTRAKERTFRAA